MDHLTLSRTLTIQYGYTAYVFGATLNGLTDEDALVQPSPGGNCLNWVTGHIVQSRGGTLALLGQKLPFAEDKYARYERGSKPVTDSSGTIPLSVMVADFAATAEGLAAGLGGLTTEMLAAKAPFSPGDNPDETVGSLLAGLAFHEGYHTGQLGILRRLAGKEGIVK
jgi:hypothetical protein